jgi:hypothetical protein
MSDHERYEELAALSASGLLSGPENKEFRDHAKVCPDCREVEEEFVELVHSGLPLTESPMQEFWQRVSTKPDHAARERFLQRARREGVSFSADVQRTSPQRADRFGAIVAATATLAAIVLLAVYGSGIYQRFTIQGTARSNDQLQQLQQQNSDLNATLTQLNESLAARQREIQSLRSQLGTANRTADSLRQQNDQAKSEAERSSSRNVPLAAELQNREQQLATARKEIERINQLHVDDDATVTAQQVQIAELSDQLRIASATLDLERQLNAAGKDIRELLTARQLHVIDVRDTDANGEPSKAFGRVFVTEGKSLTFYAFDLNEQRPIDAKHRFEVWGTKQAKAGPARNLGFLYVDDKAQRRWTLKVNDPQLVKEVDSVFVTVEPAGGARAPSGHELLYVSLGQDNHP